MPEKILHVCPFPLSQSLSRSPAAKRRQSTPSWRKLRIDVFQLEVTAAAPDPAAAALCFGGANAFIGMIWPLVEQNFNVKERRLRTRVDFDAERPSVYLYAAATLTAGQALALGLRLTTRFLAEFSKYRAEAGSPATSKQKEAV